MLRMKPAFVFERVDSKRSSTIVLAVALMGCSLLWEGCAGLPQSASAASQSSQHIAIQTPLPGSSVGSIYSQVLSVSGGSAPYHFVVSQGVLPPGLLLNALTGSISGTPTQAGTYGFTITVTGEPASSSASRAYTVPIAASVNSVSVQVTPADPSVVAGAKLQFAAVVSNTSNTAVTWSASAGSVSASGLFTAPTSTSAKSVTVTATSAADSTAHSSATATITSSIVPFRIATVTVPSAVEATAYSTSLTASGGQTPYQWKLLSGSLPSGLQLNATTGTLSGSATQAGSFTFSVQSTDAAAHTAQQSLTLDVSTSASNCGPPTYNCSRTDSRIVQIPSSIPSVGNLTGSNKIVTDPDFGNRIVRVTDSNTDPGASWTASRTFVTATSGSADENLWNIDSTLLLIQGGQTAGYPFTFNPTTLQAARMYTSSYLSTGGLKLSGGGTWSRVNPNILYTHDGTVISKYDFSDRTNPPAPQTFYDFTSSRNCLPAGFSATWKSMGGVSAGDAVFAVAFSNTGIQGTGVYVVAYAVGKGCSMLNTQTGQVTGDWGKTGAIDINDRWTIHNAKLSKDGNWLIVTPTNCTSSTCSKGPYFWQIGTTNVTSCGVGGMCGGHWTEGYSHWVNNDNSPLSNQVVRSFGEANLPSALTTVFPSGITVPFDQHQSWNNADPSDSVPFLASTWSSTSPFPAPWYNEIIGVASNGSGKTWRFAHSFITARSQRFSAYYAIGSVSQDGKFFAFSSDWMGQLGSESGTSSCTIAVDCRGDVFVVELR